MIDVMHPAQEASALLLIDIQQGFARQYWSYWAGSDGVRNNTDAEAVAGELVAFWRNQHRPVIHARHDSVLADSPLRPGQPGNAFSPHVQPADGEPVYPKNVNSAFIGTSLEHDLRSRGITTLIIAGIQTDQCVSTTARMAGNLGFRTFVVADACATFDRTGHDGVRFPAELMHATALASLHNEFATVVNAKQVLRRVLAGR